MILTKADNYNRFTHHQHTTNATATTPTAPVLKLVFVPGHVNNTVDLCLANLRRIGGLVQCPRSI